MVLIFKYYLLNVGKSYVIYPFYVLKWVLSEMLVLPRIVVMQNIGFTTRPILGIKTNEGYKFCNLVETENLTLFIEKVIM